MKAAIVFSLKVFLLNFIIYFLALGVVHYFWADSFDLAYTLLTAALPTFFFTLFHLYKHIREVKKLHGDSLRKEDFKVHQVVAMQLPLSKEQVLAKLQTNFPGKAWEMTEEANAIMLKTNRSWKSWGEKILIKVQQLNGTDAEVVIESKPVNPLTMWDFGKNQENVIYLRSLLTN